MRQPVCESVVDNVSGTLSLNMVTVFLKNSKKKVVFPLGRETRYLRKLFKWNKDTEITQQFF